MHQKTVVNWGFATVRSRIECRVSLYQRTHRSARPMSTRLYTVRVVASPDTTPADRWCGSCGRRITWRKAWAQVWHEVRWCSDACRRTKVRGVDIELEQAIRQLLADRAHGATICPSEAARVVGGDDWRTLMEPARCAARRLVVSGEVDILQQGRVVDASTAKGPIRIGRRRGSR